MTPPSVSPPLSSLPGRLSALLRGAEPLPAFLRQFAEQAQTALGCDAVQFTLGAGHLRHLLGHAHPAVNLLGERDSVSRWILEHRQTLSVGERRGLPDELGLAWPEADYDAFVGAPILHGDEALGVLYALAHEPRAFEEEVVRTLEFLAALAGVAIARQRLQARFEDSQRTLIRFALLDPLTNLASERQFDYLLRREWRRMQADAMPVSVIQLEPDQLAPQGGRVGGAQAERAVLSRLAALLDAQLYRPSDLSARLGSNRFVMLLPATNLPGAKAIAERTRRDLRALGLRHPQQGSPLTLSIGVARKLSGSRGWCVATPEELLAKAEQALAAAQAAGGDRVVSLG